MQRNIRYAMSLKLILVGDPSVGKTSLLNRIINQEYNANPPSTLGVDFTFRAIELESTVIKLQLWDTAGQEKYRSLINSYYKHSDGIILVFDLSDINSFKNLIENWLPKVVNHCGNLPPKLLFLGNKRDLKSVRSEIEESMVYKVRLEGIHDIILRDLDINKKIDYRDNLKKISFNLNGSNQFKKLFFDYYLFLIVQYSEMCVFLWIFIILIK